MPNLTEGTNKGESKEKKNLMNYQRPHLVQVNSSPTVTYPAPQPERSPETHSPQALSSQHHSSFFLHNALLKDCRVACGSQSFQEQNGKQSPQILGPSPVGPAPCSGQEGRHLLDVYG